MLGKAQHTTLATGALKLASDEAELFGLCALVDRRKFFVI